ncbi:HPP family protein [Aliinostoc sp. HNIBRCY26]|uniref:HPP family protein n=1 Tax=Aliinostoc sp. HNIBRCY26 TaxID=3418997 RepID=UPI003CFF1D9C
MKRPHSTPTPLRRNKRSPRHRLSWKDELVLATAPTIVILTVFSLVEVLTSQRLLFASLASSAFLIYLDPQHETNTVKTLVISQIMAATIGFVIFMVMGSGYLSGGTAMIMTIVLMIVLDVMHPPAVSTSLSFALKAGNESNLVLFALAVGITALLVGLERFALWLLVYLEQK